MYKVFFNDSTIQVCSKINKSSNNNIATCVDSVSYNFVNQMISDIESGKLTFEYVIQNPDLKQIWEQFRSHFNAIPAAGGLVKNDAGSLLFIKRMGVWDLPKGKIEKKETPEHAAIREVEEECGLTNLQLIKPLESTFHIYRSPYLSFPDNLVLKETKWFLMTYSGVEIPVPQLEEDIEEVRWFAESELDEVRANTYPSLRELLEKTLPLI
jgi:8-oxo-dGTP pyrophosphatase MutT (NUDIX family)